MNGNDFFGGPANPQPNPAMTNTREYADFSPTGVRPPVKSTTRPARAVLLVIAGVAMVGTVLVGYRAMMPGTDIVLPGELLGMPRVDPDSKKGQIAEGTESGFETDFQTYVGEDVEVHVGTYRAGTGGLILVAAEAGEGGNANADEYFAWFSRGFGNGGLPLFELTEVDAGPNGGRMQCVNSPSSEDTGGGCAWIAQDTLGVIILDSSKVGVTEAARTVRAEIEQ